MTKKESRELDKSLAKQLAEVTRSKAAARKLLAKYGLLDKCVPIEKKKNVSRTSK